MAGVVARDRGRDRSFEGYETGRIEQAREAAGKARAHFEAAAAQHLLADLDAWLAEVGER